MSRKAWWAATLAVVAPICFSCSRTPATPSSEPSPVSVKASLGSSLVKSGACSFSAAGFLSLDSLARLV